MSVVESAKEQLLSNGSWLVDPAHSTVEFRVKHMMIQTVKGRFRDFDGAIVAGDGRERVALALRGQLDRADYGLVWNRVLETGGVLVGDTVDLVLDVAAVRVG